MSLVWDIMVLPGADHVSIVINNHEQGTVHAEQNAISDAASRGCVCKR